MNDPRAWLVVLFFVFFGVVWIGALNFIARMGGWSRLAKVYRHRGPFDGFRIRFGSGDLRGGPLLGLPCNYGSCLTLGSNPHGLYLAVLVPFRPSHPPLFIPWRDIAARVERGWLFTYVTFEFQKAAPVRLRVGQTSARRLISEAGSPDSISIESAE